MDGLRQAALTIAALSAADRAWMLERVDARAREQLAALLEELRGLDLSLDAQSVRRLVQPAAPKPAAPSGLEGAPAAAVLEALAGEPDWSVGALLRAHAWGWREDLLHLLGAERRPQVLRALPAGVRPAPKAAQALAAAVAKRLDAHPRSFERPRPAARVRRALGRLFRREAAL